MFRNVIIAFVFVVFGTSLARADDPQLIEWSDLVLDDSFPDPFKKLSQEQLQDLGYVVRVRHLVAADKISADGADIKEAARIERSLIKAGVDIQWLVAQHRHVGRLREMQAKAVQPNVVGKRVKLSGYVIPVKSSGDLVTEFLLVPTVDVCRHTSRPPPPNQTVFVRFSQGITRQGVATVARVTGRIEAKQTTRILQRAHGPTRTTAAYAIAPQNVDTARAEDSASTRAQLNEESKAESNAPGSRSRKEPLQSIAFGSCTRQMQDAPLLNTVVAAKPDLFLMLGDVVYPDINDDATALIKPWPNKNTLKRMKRVYAQMAAKPEYQKLKKSIPMMAVWDDHDYGINDGSSDFTLKVESQKLFLDFFDEPADSQRRKTPGIYDAKILGPAGKRVQIILLDTRYFRTPPLPDTRSAEKKKALNIAGRYAPNGAPAATVLGKVQWRWLEEQFRKPAELRLLVSSYPVIPYELGRDCWGNCPLERKKLFKLIGETKANGVVILSGDVHFSEISKTDEGPYPLLDFTSSALAAPTVGNETFANSYRISKTYAEVNFGLVEVDWAARPAPHVTLKAIGLDGASVFEHTIGLEKLRVESKR